MKEGDYVSFKAQVNSSWLFAKSVFIIMNMKGTQESAEPLTISIAIN